MLKKSLGSKFDPEEITSELTGLFIEFIQQVEAYKSTNNNLINVTEIEKMYADYHGKRERIIQDSYTYFRELVINRNRLK
jgi:hypothetical protein